MKGLAPEESSAFLAILQALRSSCKFYDVHVHPYEVLFDQFSYQDEVASPGLLSLSGRRYSAPVLGSVKLSETAEADGESVSQRFKDVWVMMLRKVYGNVGERVFVDHMNLCGIDKALMLPVPLESCSAQSFEERMRWVRQLYANEQRFWIAGSIPAALAGDEIGPYAEALVRRYGIRAIKCHPVISGIDLGSSSRKQWLEALLVACHELKLPLVLHGGRNSRYWEGNRGDFGSLEHLKEVNLSLSGAPVVLAHAGCHRCSAPQVEQEELPLLNRMLKRHSNLHVDISGLAWQQLKLVLQSVDHDRILFGSDALYVQQWEAVTMTMHALKELGNNVEDAFVKIASTNPERTIFGDGGSHADLGADKVESVSGASEGKVATGGLPQGGVFLRATEQDSRPGLLGFVGTETGEQDG